jgi:RNA polymerase sigma-70 factor (ECF subfamily)
MRSANPDTDDLIEQASQGDASAGQQLLARHYDRLRRMVAVRLDRRLAARLDPSDVVQESLAEAARLLPDYLRERPLPFYPWLRQLAGERLAKLHRRHLHAGKRDVRREEAQPLTDESARDLAQRLLASGLSPSNEMVRRELLVRVRAALQQLPERDREVLTLRYLEQMRTREIAEVLGVAEGTVKSRHVRALERLRDRLGDVEEDER